MTANVANQQHQEEESNHAAAAFRNSKNSTTRIMIPKGSVIYEWTNPYLIVPLVRWRRRRRNNQDNKTTPKAASSSAIKKKRKRPSEVLLAEGGEQDEELELAELEFQIDTICQQFPRWKKGCHWHVVFDQCRHHHHHHRNETLNEDNNKEDYEEKSSWLIRNNDPKLQTFLRNLSSKVLSTEDDDGHDDNTAAATATTTNGIDDLIFRELSIRTLLKVIELKLPGGDNDDEETNAATRRRLDLSNQRLAHTTSNSTDDHVHADDVLLIELWPLIQRHISWDDCRYLFGAIKTNLHVLAVPHPLKSYAQETIFRLDQQEFNKLWTTIIQQQQQQHLNDTPADNRVYGNDRRHYACQLLLDKVAAVPTRWVGVLLQDPTLPTSKTCTNTSSERPSLSASYIDRSDLKQSCLPKTCLEVTTADIPNDNNRRETLSCSLIALYDLDLTVESRKSSQYTIASQPKRKDCSCFRCTYETRKVDASFQITSEDIPMVLQLAHSNFQNQNFDKASELYRQCYDMIQTPTKEKADCLHSMAAVLLSQNKFAEAQRLWKNHEKFASLHNEISVQCDKQSAYKYFQPLDESSIQSLRIPSYNPIESLISSCSNPSSPKSKSIFLAKSIIEPSICNQLIEWVQDYAKTNNGWTTSRHYAVPTTDVPLHEVPSLLKWFHGFMAKTLFPLLHDQFRVNRADKRNRFYVHDAFLVRYEGSGSNNFLPLHYDESTHSCVIALNDCKDVNDESKDQSSSSTPTFSGGGTFFYDLQRSFSPPKGGMVSFRGDQCLHGGNPVLEGTRYIIAIFLYLDEDLAAPVLFTEDCDSQQEEKAFEFSFF